MAKTKLSDADDAALLGSYISLRDRRAERKKQYTQDDLDDKTRQEKIESEFLRRFEERGTDSVSVKDMGTAYLSTFTSATVEDWDMVLDFVLDEENDALDFLEKKVNKTAVKEFIEETGGDLPPGVKWSEARTVKFRRK